MGEEEMGQLLAVVEDRLGGSWIDTIEHLRETNQIHDIANRLANGDIEGAVQGVEAAATRFAAEVLDSYTASAKAAAKWLDKAKPTKLVTFDGANKRAADWAQANQAEMVREVTQQTRRVIANVVSRGVQAGTNPIAVARDIRSSIGLTEHQERHIASYRTALESGDLHNALSRELRDGRSDKSLRAAIRDQRSLSTEQIDSMVDRYRTNYVAFRAEVIARTEGLRALHQGTDEMYEQAIENGDLESDELVQEWHNSGRGNVRDSHQSVTGPDGKSKKKAIGEYFITGAGNHLRYPGDPDAPVSETAQCACVVSTRIDPNATPLADAPAGFEPGSATVREGIPQPDKIRTNALYRVSVDDLRGKLQAPPGGGEDKQRVQSIRDAWAADKRLPPINLIMTPSGKYFVNDGRHRLLVALEQDRDVLVQFDATASDDVLTGTVKLKP